MSYFQTGALIALAGAFLASGISKLQRPAVTTRFVETLFGERLRNVSRALVLALAIVECAVVLALVIMTNMRVVILQVILGFLILATLVIVWVAIKTGDVDCGCFGDLERDMPWWFGVVRNVFLIALSLVALSADPRHAALSPSGVVGGLASLLTLWLLSMVIAHISRIQATASRDRG